MFGVTVASVSENYLKAKRSVSLNKVVFACFSKVLSVLLPRLAGECSAT